MPPTGDLSTCECETGALVELTKVAIMYGGILTKLHRPQFEAIHLCNDNASTLTFATKYSGSHKRIRYMLPKVNCLWGSPRSRVSSSYILATEELSVNLGTMLHTGSAFKKREAVVLG